MDHLVTRMRRNSENLLLLAGHEGARKWSEPAPLSDVARAAVSEIEQYGRVSLNSVPGIFIEGQAVSDIVHLFAELIENATMFSPKETQVHVSARELSSGGVLIEVADQGVGISEARLTELNWRLDNPPVIDVSVTRHMGLFAVGRLAQRHGVRVRLRTGTDKGLTALVWLPDAIVNRKSGTSGGYWEYPTEPTRAINGQASPANGVPAATAPGPRASRWFRDPRQFGPPGTETVPDTGPYPAPVAAESARADRTATGLPVRAPGANYVRGAFGGPVSTASGGFPSIGGGFPSIGGGVPGTGGVPVQQRAPVSPDQTRSRLSGFQRGARRAKDHRPGGGEEAGR
jgi:anti-sigma regulatory factor (Ser/Thr protein kinase)